MFGYTIIKTERLDALISQVVSLARESDQLDVENDDLQEQLALKSVEIERLKRKNKVLAKRLKG